MEYEVSYEILRQPYPKGIHYKSALYREMKHSYSLSRVVDAPPVLALRAAASFF